MKIYNPNLIIRKNTIFSNFILLFWKQNLLSHKKFAYVVFLSNNQIRIVCRYFSEFELVSINCFSMKLVPNENIKFFKLENFDKLQFFDNFEIFGNLIFKK